MAPETIVENQGESLLLKCETSDPNLNITWIQTLGKTGANFVAEDSRVRFINSGYDLQFEYIVPSDEEFYTCGVYDEEQGTFQSIKKYFVYVRSKKNHLNPTATLSVRDQVVNFCSIRSSLPDALTVCE